jgi:hypothetical protein
VEGTEGGVGRFSSGSLLNRQGSAVSRRQIVGRFYDAPDTTDIALGFIQVNYPSLASRLGQVEQRLQG